MLDKLRKKKITPYLLISFAIISLLILFLPLVGIFKVTLVLILTLFLISLFSYKLGFFLFLFLRPAIDFSTSYKLFSLNSISFNIPVIFGAAMLIFSIIVIIQHFKEIKHDKLARIWLIFVFWGLISLVYSFAPGETIKELSRYFSIFFSFILGILVIKNSKDLTNLAKIIIFSALIPSLVALYQFFTNSGLIEDGSNRLFGTMTHPNMLAFYLILPITLSIFVFLNIKKTRLEFYLYLLLSIFYTFILTLTYTRGAYLALAIIIGIIGFLKFRKFLLSAFVALLIFYVLIIPFQKRINSIFIHSSYGSIEWRINLWHDGYNFFKKKPLLGYGSGLAKKVIGKNRNFILGATEPHNDYLKLALEGGIINIVIYLSLIIILIIKLKENYKKQTRKRIKMLNLFMLIIILSFSIMSFGDNVFDDTALQWQLWALLGGLLSIQKK